MIKYELRRQGFQIRDKEPNKSLITLIWVFFTIFIISGTFYAIFKVVGKAGMPEDPLEPLFDNLGEIGYFLLLLGALLLYMVLKFFMTLLFCYAHASSSIHMKILEGTAMPVCFCREAFKVWQTLLIYLIPVAAVYSIVFFMCVISGAGAIYMIILFFMGFYMAYDLTLVLYVLIYKIKDKIDYISIDHHIYYVTLYKKTYVK